MTLHIEDTGPAYAPFDWSLPALRQAPAAFKQAMKVAAQNWQGRPLAVILPSGQVLHLGHGGEGEVRLVIRNYRFIRRILASGDIGFAEGFIEGDWDTPDLSALLEAFSHNFDRLAQLMVGNPFARALNFISHALNRNSRRGSSRNIHAHYDLGNAFYGEWLDTGMTYSAALFDRPGLSLEEAQNAKYRALCEGMDLQPGQRVLEIGCGWGGFAEFAAKTFGARVDAITISRAQHDYAKRRIFEAGLADRVDIQLTDYRDVTGVYDRVASIEMFEAVGEAYWPTYFAKIAEVLAPGGKAGLQIITIDDDLFDGYRARPDFIQKYVFPGGMLPSRARLLDETGAARLVWGEERRFGGDYARTLRLWADRFEAAWSKVQPLGFDDRFHRLWRYYLGYCEAGFLTGRTDLIQLTLEKG